MSELLSTAEFDESSAASRDGAATAPVAPTDGERLMRFVRYRDETAFAQVVETHATMVWGVCAQILRHHQDIEDAFQATFLILARKARSIRAADSAAGWLCRVAYRTALLAHGRRRRRQETSLADEPASLDDQLAEIERNEQSVRLLEELNALPARYREAIVLCYLEGRTRAEAAEQMGLSSQAVKGLLARGTRLLRTRLVRRGIALSTSIGVVNLAMSAAQGAVAPALIASTVAQGASFALKLPLVTTGFKGTATSGAAAYTLAEKGIIAMAISAASKPVVGIMGVCLAVGMLTVAEARPKLSKGKGSMDVVFVAAAVDGGETVVSEARPAESTDVAKVNRLPVGETVVSEARPAEEHGWNSLVETPAAPAPATAQFYGTQTFAVQPLLPTPAAANPMSSPVPGAAVSSNAGTITYGQVPAAAGYPVPQPVFAQPSPWNPGNPPTPVAAPSGPSAATLQLEQEYWDLKAQGLKKKAEAIQLRVEVAEQLATTGSGGKASMTEGERLELAAERDLTLAEVKLCEMNAQRVRETVRNVHGQVPILHTGLGGEQVMQLQKLLNAKLPQRPPLDVDGDFGAITEEAVKAFQRENDLKPTGAVDEATQKKLGMKLQRVFPTQAIAPPQVQGAGMWMQPPAPFNSSRYDAQPTWNQNQSSPPVSSQPAPPLNARDLQAKPHANGTVQVQSAEEASIVTKEVADELTELYEQKKKIQQRIEQLERESKAGKK